MFKFPKFLLLFMIVAALVGSFQAQNSKQDFLDAHNTVRAELGVEPFTWDEKVAAYAQLLSGWRAANCNLSHSGGPYGENLAMGSGDFTGKMAVDLWVQEKQYYDYKTNLCGGVCGHYIQVVWQNSVRLGCARVKCDNKNWWFVACNYDPPGNIIGQRPYSLMFASEHFPVISCD